MRVFCKKNSNFGMKIILSIFGISFIGIILVSFDVFGISHIKQLINNSSSSGGGYIKEIVYDIFLGIFLLFSVCLPVYLYVIAREIRVVINELEAKPLTNSSFREACNNKDSYIEIWETYSRAFIKNIEGDKYKQYNNKTRENADLYFNAEEIVLHHSFKLPLISFLKLITVTFVGLGILGTFIGFSQAFAGGIDIQNQDQLNVIIQSLKVAFNTSIFGIFSSIIYNFLITHPITQLLNDNSRELCDLLDSFYYISDEQCLRKLGEIVYETGNEITSISNDTANNVREVLNEGRADFTAELDRTSDTLRTVTGELEKAPNFIKVMNDELKGSANIIKENHEKMLNTSIKAIEDKIKQTCDTYQVAVADLVERMESTTQKINNIKDGYSSVEKSLSSITTNVEKVEVDLNDTFARVPAEIQNAIGSLVDAAITTSKTTEKLTELEKLPGVLTEIFNQFAATTKVLETTYDSVLSKISILYDVCNSKENNTSDELKKYIETLDINSLTNLKYNEALGNMQKSIDESQNLLQKVLSFIKDKKEGKKISEVNHEN